MKALVTGATGFVGGHLVRALVAADDTVVGLYRRPEARAGLEALGAEPAPGTLADERSLAEALQGVDVVYHLAGLVAGSEAELMQTNGHGTARVVAACRAAGVRRIVYCSSQAALGPSPRGVRLTEDATAAPVTAYGRSKLAGEAAVQAADGVAWSIVRPPAVYGPGDREFLRLFQIVRWRVAPVFGWGGQQLSLVYAPDLARALATAGREPKAAGQVYHAAHDEVATAAGVARAAGTALGGRPLVLPLPAAITVPIVAFIGAAAERAGRRTVVNRDKLAEFLADAWLLDSSKARRDLDWTAATGLADGMRQTAAWYRNEGWL